MSAELKSAPRIAMLCLVKLMCATWNVLLLNERDSKQTQANAPYEANSSSTLFCYYKRYFSRYLSSSSRAEGLGL